MFLMNFFVILYLKIAVLVSTVVIILYLPGLERNVVHAHDNFGT